MKTAPQKERTGAPVTNWVAYQAATARRAVASVATITDRTTTTAGREARGSDESGRGDGPEASAEPGSRGSGVEAEWSSGGLDTLAPYRT